MLIKASFSTLKLLVRCLRRKPPVVEVSRRSPKGKLDSGALHLHLRLYTFASRLKSFLALHENPQGCVVKLGDQAMLPAKLLSVYSVQTVMSQARLPPKRRTSMLRTGSSSWTKPGIWFDRVAIKLNAEEVVVLKSVCRCWMLAAQRQCKNLGPKWFPQPALVLFHATAQDLRCLSLSLCSVGNVWM